MEGSNKTKPISKLQVKKLHPAALLPKKGSPLAAGYDLCANEDAVVPKGGKAKISTGLSWACPPNTYARVAPRSGLAWKNSISVGAGVIDEDYRGEVCVILFNHGTEDFIVKYSCINQGSTTASRRSSSRRSSPQRSRRSLNWLTPSAARADSVALEWPRTRLELISSVIILTQYNGFPPAGRSSIRATIPRRPGRTSPSSSRCSPASLPTQAEPSTCYWGTSIRRRDSLLTTAPRIQIRG